MASIDELFKKPNLPTGSLKRKLEIPDAQEAYKSTKINGHSSPNGRHANGGVPVEDVADDGEVEAGPDLPPEDGEEEERFFGGGVTKDAAEALEYLDQHDGGEDLVEEKIDSSWLRRLANTFEKKVTKNAELRARYETEPQKFMASEADLDAEIKSWSLLSEHPTLYPEFAQSEALPQLVGLLAHENTDIAIAAIEIVSELLDEDVQAEQEDWDALVASLLDADLLQLLMSNLTRLDEDNEADRSGVYHSLSVLESLAGQQSVAERIGHVNVLLWLCNRLNRREDSITQNKQYAAEVLQVLLQSSSLLRVRLASEVDGVDLFLQLLAAYRKRDPPKGSTEEEYAENLFDALTCVVDEPLGKTKLLEAEGVELMLIMLKDGNFSKLRALRLVDHACGGNGKASVEVCEKLVDAAGLKTVFRMFMKKTDGATLEHIVGIFASLLRLLPGESAARIRTLAKFAEKGHEKVSKLVDLRQSYARRVGTVDKEIRGERAAMSAGEVEQRNDEWFSRRLEGGLYVLQTLDIILAWLYAEDPSAKSIITKLVGVETVSDSLREQMAELGPAAEGVDGDTQEMLRTLVDCLQ
ncbi:hypothetical protein BAUCODRAFT_38875 [Baudoinia panamericana UAMH 10762]|uniref:Beta-catenin-like protein 1 N-terminal domain-containing protein n=1 Tax=Baudoinia panamericana (strain UAMH 10762) TaxID=717646 RepID=M2MZH4_BAUPA|nr:uncharacterized protein BAUCODRAFT_38875 [Baudoinia panamericana UAMH 10762]EMC91740.1 hypothetical protein BAUCODRAFT_38875 [Baudoinia panamericana UAMH 10762]